MLMLLRDPSLISGRRCLALAAPFSACARVTAEIYAKSKRLLISNTCVSTPFSTTRSECIKKIAKGAPRIISPTSTKSTTACWPGEPKQATYWQLYDHTARAIKKVNTRLRVGGPATAQAAWVDAFIEHCARNNVPLDFVSTHVYGNDRAQDVFGTNENIPRDK